MPVAAAAQSPDSILQRAVNAYAKLNSVRADFRQTLTNTLTGNSITTSGTLLRRKPNLLNISFENGDHIVADGKDLWLYVPSSVPGQVIRTPVQSAASSGFDPAGEILVSPRTRYEATSLGTASVGGRSTHILLLRPRAADGPFTKATIWVDDTDGNVRQLEVTAANGLTRFITIGKLSPNAPVARSEFRFAPPKGVRVVDQLRLNQ